MANLDIYGQPQGQGESWPAIRRALQDLARGVSYYPYDLLGAPVDVANLALSAVGLGSKEPVLGSDQLRRISQQLGFAQPSTGSTAETVGRFAAGLTNPAAPVRAVQRVAEPTEDALRQIVREIQTTAPRGQIAYHGTNKDFDKYRVKNRGLAYYFTPDPEQASFYSGMGEGANVRPVDLDLNKTYRGGQIDEIMEVVKKEDDYYPYSLSKIKESLENRTPLAFHTPSVIKALKQKGYDSFVEYENGVEQIGVFSNKNIKPAFGKGGLLDQQPENLEKIYHGTSPKAAKQIESAGFDINKSADGTIWFTSNPQIGEVAATGKGAVVERLIDLNKLKLGGWDETDKFSVDELISQGFDGLRLVDGDEITYQIFNPEKLKKPLK